jgi:hypothetical protein
VIKRIADVPLTHHFGLNAFVAREQGQELVGEHDERESGQEEVYVAIGGPARERFESTWRDSHFEGVPRADATPTLGP